MKNEFLYLMSFLGAFMFSHYSIKRVIYLAVNRNLMDDPSDPRKVHKQKTPNLGGVGVLMAFALMFSLFAVGPVPTDTFRLLGGVIILFFVGLKDDLLPISPRRRLIYELTIVTGMVIGSRIQMTSLYGLFGIYEIPIWLGTIFSVIFVIGVINAFNMIDGIDSLLGTVSLILSFTFAYLFYYMKFYVSAQISLVLAGALIGFLCYNRHPAKTFMGDNGSMFLGGIFASFTLLFLNHCDQLNLDYLMVTSPASIGMALLSVPLFDMLAVFLIRLMNGSSPFKADRRHNHHRLLDMNFGHRKATYALCTAQLVIMAVAVLTQPLGNMTSFLITFFVILGLEIFLILLHRNYMKHKKALPSVASVKEYSVEKMKIYNKNTIDQVCKEASDNERLRMNHNIHNSLDEPVHKLINALQIGTSFPVHRHMHPPKKETFVLLQGKLNVLIYDDQKNLKHSVELSKDSGNMIIELMPDDWHTIEVLEPDTAILEIKEGPYIPYNEMDIMKFQ